MPPQISLLCLCASHIDTEKRLQHFDLLLASVSAQRNANFKLFLGISFADNDIKKQVVELLERNNADTIHTFLFSKPQPQFVRYKAIMNALRNKGHITPEREGNTYLAFSDDDDLWSPQRMSILYAGAQRLHADPRNPNYTFTRTQFTAEVEKWEITRWDQLPTTRGRSTCWFDRPREYSDVVCKFTLFTHFFQLASAELLAHPYCDLVFKEWIGKNTIHLRIDLLLPIYFYRRNPRDIKHSNFSKLVYHAMGEHKDVFKFCMEVSTTALFSTKLSDMSYALFFLSVLFAVVEKWAVLGCQMNN
jgi:hypothetical protein